MNSTKNMLLAALAMFIVQFNLGYVFHDVALGAWFHQHIPFARQHYVIPYLGAAFAVYALIAAYLFPAFHSYFSQRSIFNNGLRFGVLMGVLFDALQGGIIEVATFKGMGLEVFLVDSSYHVFAEGILGGLTLAAVYKRRGVKVGGASAPRAASRPPLGSRRA